MNSRLEASMLSFAFFATLSLYLKSSGFHPVSFPYFLPILLLFISCLLITFLEFSLWGITLTGAGYFSNSLVMLMNGYMPLEIPENSNLIFIVDNPYRLTGSDTLAPILGDWISLGNLGIASPGDFIMIFGVLISCIQLSRYCSRIYTDKKIGPTG